MNPDEAVNIIKTYFNENGNNVDVSQQRGDPFTAELANGYDGINVTNLGNQPFLSWDVFRVAIELLNKLGGTAIRGNAMNYRLGEQGLPLNSVEGYIANKIYRKNEGDSVFKRISPVANILVHVDICRHGNRVLILNQEPGWSICKTLSKQKDFLWQYDNNGGVEIKSGNIQAGFNSNDINIVIDHIYRNTQGVQLGSCITGIVPENSIGGILQNRSISGFTRAWCSYLVAILVSEGIINYEDLGRGPSRGIWLYPECDYLTRKSSDTADIAVNEEELDNPDAQGDAITSCSINSLNQECVFQEISNQLKEISNRIEATRAQQSARFQIQFSDINPEYSQILKKRIKDWEKQCSGSSYIYIYKANNKAELMRINDSYAKSREQNTEQRAFARINKGSSESQVLYVGSSHSIGQRTKDHLGFSSKSVFSLQIFHWCRELDGGIDLEILRFSPGTDSVILQSIEDGLWNKFKPMFGRQGQR